MNLERMQEFTRTLIGIDSVTGNEAQAARWLAQTLQERGMRVRSFDLGSGRCNLLATWSAESPRILFNTHFDTVPQQYGPFEDAERIYGRGACDTHGVLGAQLEAMQDLHESGVASLGLLLVVGEETVHDGALHAGSCNEIREPDILIVGEPTENKLMTSQKGRLKAELLVYGVEGHSGYPELFDSAVEKLSFFLQKIWQAPWLKRDSSEGNTVNVVLTHAGGADNQVPPFASARLMFRCAEPCEDVKRQFLDLLQQAEAGLAQPKSSRPHYELKWDPAQNDPVTNLCTLAGFETASAAYNTDIAYFGWQKCKTFLLGPGSILQAHRDWNPNDWQQGEWILKREQVRGVELYKQLVQSAGL